MKKNIQLTETTPIVEKKSHFSFLKKNAKWLLFFVSIFIYANTFWNAYTLDDVAFITENKFTQKGISGIKDIFSHDAFYGFYGERANQILSGGRYRPFTISMFAIEHQLFGNQPWIGHLINVLLFGLSIVIMFSFFYKVLLKIFDEQKSWFIAFVTSFLFSIHPIHTEVVANIKGRDEIMVLLGVLASLYFAVKYIDKKDKASLVWSLVFYFMALFSKENALLLMFLMPGVLFIFYKMNLKNIVLNSLPFLLASFIFLGIRYMVLDKSVPITINYDLLNNPFVKYENGKYVLLSLAEKSSHIMFSLGHYIKLLIFPHPLTHDYYPEFVSNISWSSLSVFSSLILYLFLIGAGIYFTLKKHVLSFACLIYFSGLLLVSNIFFPVGTNMGERFIYFSSLGFCLVCAYFSYQFFNSKSKNIFLFFFVIISALMIVKTISRNFDWKNDLTLYQADFEVSKKSIKINSALGGEYVTLAQKENSPEKRKKIIQKSIPLLKKAITKHPQYKMPYLSLGSAYFMNNLFDSTLYYYNKALELDPNFTLVKNNLPIVYKGAGKHAGEVEQNIDKALSLLLKSYELDSSDYEVLRLLGTAYGNKNEKENALNFFLKALKKMPEDKIALQNVATAYSQLGNQEEANYYMNKASSK